MGYLTPNVAPATSQCRALFVPNDEAYVAIVRGLLQVLTFPESWDKFGTLTQQEAADACVDMFDRFCLQQDMCRMIGELIEYAGDVSPKPEWLACDGSEVLIVDYPDLYAVIADKYGVASADHFKLPDFANRAAAGAGSRAVGTAYGSETHTITTAQLPAHNHADSGHQHSTGNSATGVAVTPGELPVLIPNLLPALTGVASANIQNTGGGEAIPTIGPRLAITYLIVAKDG